MAREPQTLGEIFKETARRFPQKNSFQFKKNGSYVSISWSEAEKKVDSLAAYLEKTIGTSTSTPPLAILSENRPEWATIDLAAQLVGAPTVPIYTSLSPLEIQYILNDSQAYVIAVSSQSLLEKIIPIQASLRHLKQVIIFDPVAPEILKKLERPVVSTEVLYEIKETPNPRKSRVVSSSDVATIIYTSGTTGEPKGVLLTHRNLIHNLTSILDSFEMGPNDIHLSFLPLSHVFERMAGYYLMLYLGATIAYTENMDTIPQNLLEVRPTFILGVPRFFEKIQNKTKPILEKVGFFKRKPFFLQWLLRKLAGWKFKNKLGGRIRFCISGGAPLAKEIAEFFSVLNVFIYEGYGLTETSPVISVNREGCFKFGSVGVPLKSVRVQIMPDGEIATKSESVMKGYLNKPEATSAILKDGWFYTGDLGVIDADGFLHITGRKKDLIVTSGGKKIAPKPIEELIEKTPCILRCVLFGEKKNFLTALIVPKKEEVLKQAAEGHVAFTSYSELLQKKEIYAWLMRCIEKQSDALARFERIKKALILEDDFSQDLGELTPTLKVKREVVLAKYKEKLERLYTDVCGE